MNYIEDLKPFLQGLNNKGVLLTSGNEKPNTMTASWGFLGVMWGKNMLVTPVRPSRHTHNIVKDTAEFCISAPLDENYNKVLSFCGTKSGRDFDKFKELNLATVKCNKINTVRPEGKFLHVECKLVYTNSIIKDRLPLDIVDKWYKDNQYHTMYYGEIVDVYTTE